jgi:precorrin-8X/cobalt-precorrin-8 methylmutase
MSAGFDYARDGAEIYRRSFAIIRKEADLSRFSPDEARVAVRIIHACGMVEIAQDLVFSPDFVAAARAALVKGKPIFCDSKMVANGITRGRLPANNDIICTLEAPGIAERAAKLGTTRSAAALDFWLDGLGGALVAIGNAPTALFRLLELIDQGAPKPAAVIGMPVGFVGAAESKEALAGHGGTPFLIVKGRKGGSAMAVAVVNALASEAE